MAIFKKLNDNHQDLPNSELWDKSKYEAVKQNGFIEYTRLNRKFYAKSIFEDISSEDEIKEILSKLWRSKEDGTFDVLVLHNNNMPSETWQNKQLEIWKILKTRDLEEGYKNGWLYVFDLNTNTVIIPDVNEKHKTSRLSRFNPRNFAQNKFQRELRNARFAQYTLQSIFDRALVNLDQESIVKQLNKSEKSLDKWKERLIKRNYWDEDEVIIQGGSMHVNRSNWKVRSNLTRRGRFIMTNKRLIYVRRKFAFFGFGALIPFLAFVRPSNKVLLFFQTIFQIMKVPIQLFKAARPAMGPIAVGFAFSFSFLDFSIVMEFWSKITSYIPGLDFVAFGLGWVIKNPQALPVIAGSWVLINNALRLIFMRGEELIILPYDQLSTLFLDRSLLVGRWKVKGISTVQAPPNGLEYKMQLRDLNKDSEFGQNRDLVLANQVFKHLMSNEEPLELNST
ncbi:MAG: hypothetical protein GPJ54_14405 [Candidatus Heimdallarchaeota archaeon]|nr:hypothetical protein [Candidatus Heimdallarchaeota archaeon]